jgi:hypothetical protein
MNEPIKYIWDCDRCGAIKAMESSHQYFSINLNKLVPAGHFKCSACGMQGLACPHVGDGVLGYKGTVGIKKELKMKEVIVPKEYNEFANKYISQIQFELREIIDEKSPLRNKFKVHKLEDGICNLIFDNYNGAYFIDRDCGCIHYTSKNLIIPTFELSFNPEYEINKITKDYGCTLPEDFKPELLKMFIDDASFAILNEEMRIYDTINDKLSLGSGELILRQDITVLSSSWVDSIGFSIFEHFGVGVILDKII